MYNLVVKKIGMQVTLDYLDENNSVNEDVSADPSVAEIIPSSESVIQHAHKII